MNPIAKLLSGPSLARSVLEHSGEAVVVASDSGDILFANQHVQSWFGYGGSEITGLTLTGLLPSINSRDCDAHRMPAMSQFAAPVVTQGLQRVICKDGSEVMVDVKVVAVQEQNHPLILANFSKAKTNAISGQMLESERLDAVAEMISGLAHESRNALQRAVACLDLMELDLVDDDRHMDLTAKIRKSLSDLLNNYDEVKRFAQPITLNRNNHQIIALFKETYLEYEELRGPIDAETTITDDGSGQDLAKVDCDRLKEVFRHLIENALDHGRRGIKLTVQCESAQLDGQPAIRVLIHDDGEPFSQEALVRAFEPFYTTKQHGTGLGLSISRRIIRAHGGIIAVSNPPRGGAMVEIMLPKLN
ncbi:MAG: PAS domain-containing sensor histidine kinase [Planctomycetales bacterium]|nr:PAS domain-containing sensor histidine kinase [Planctomycetales bacterium]